MKSKYIFLRKKWPDVKLKATQLADIFSSVKVIINLLYFDILYLKKRLNFKLNVRI